MKTFARLTAGLLVSLLTIGACSGDRKNADILAQDSSLVRDLALANRDTLSQPQLQDVGVRVNSGPIADISTTVTPPSRSRVVAREQMPEAPRRVVRRTRSAPEPRPVVTESGNLVTVGASGSAPKTGMIASGEQISLYSGQRICTNTNSVGDRFTATLVEPVQGSNGAVIPAGATATVEVIRAARSSGSSEPVQLEFAVRSITINGRTYQVMATVTSAQVDRSRSESRADDVRKVATGAAIGAIAGQILGRRTKSTVIGAATGAAAGAVVAATNSHYDGCIPAGGRITIRLTEPVLVQM